MQSKINLVKVKHFLIVGKQAIMKPCYLRQAISFETADTAKLVILWFTQGMAKWVGQFE